MPVGSPKPQTIATKRYEEKAGIISKSYKLKKELVEQFAEACEKARVSQAAQISKMMREFIETTKRGKHQRGAIKYGGSFVLREAGNRAVDRSCNGKMAGAKR